MTFIAFAFALVAFMWAYVLWRWTNMALDVGLYKLATFFTILLVLAFSTGVAFIWRIFVPGAF